MRDWFDGLETSIRDYVPNILGALIILIIGWIIAVVVAAVVRGVLNRTTLDERLARTMGADERTQISLSDWITRAVFWLIILFTLAAFFQVLDLPNVSQPLDRALEEVFRFVPRVIAAGVLLLIAWIIARILKAIVTRVLTAANIDERLNSQVRAQPQGAQAATGQGELPPPVQRPEEQGGAAPPAGGRAPAVSLAATLGDVVYWLVFLLFLPAILNALNLPGLLAPVQSLVNEVLAFIPNLVVAAIILVVGWFVATVIRRIVVNLLAAVGTDRLAERVGIAQAMGTQTLSGLIGLLVYVLIFVPVVIAALEALQLQTISQPASNMLNAFLAAIPNVFAAAIILIIAFFVGRLIGSLVAGLLAGFGFNSILERLGFTRQPGPNERTPSDLAGYAVLIATMLFASIEAAEVLGFNLLAGVIVAFTVFAGQVLLGLIILAIGIYLANLVYGLVRNSDVEQAGLLATAARVAILVLAAAMALRAMGIANDIINLAFGLLLGAVAVAVAIAFGVGGREIAGRELERFVEGRRGGGGRLPPGPTAPPPPPTPPPAGG
jgi:hypothetical protein